jgi:hypothetical protein
MICYFGYYRKFPLILNSQIEFQMKHIGVFVLIRIGMQISAVKLKK